MKIINPGTVVPSVDSKEVMYVVAGDGYRR